MIVAINNFALSVINYYIYIEMGKRKILQSVNNNQETVKTEPANIENVPNGVSFISQGLQPSPTKSSALILQSILRSLTALQKEWPQVTYKAVLERFGCMPKNGWTQSFMFFRDSFGLDTTLEKFKEKAKFEITSDNGQPCSIARFKADSSKRLKLPQTVLSEENNFQQNKLLIEVNTLYKATMAELLQIDIEKVKKQGKFPLTESTTRHLMLFHKL